MPSKENCPSPAKSRNIPSKNSYVYLRLHESRALEIGGTWIRRIIPISNQLVIDNQGYRQHGIGFLQR